MRLSGTLKKASGAIILITEIVMFWQISVMISLATLPVWHKWIFRLTLGLFAVFLAVSAALYIVCEIKGRKPALFIIWGLICLFVSHTPNGSPDWLQAVLTVAILLHLILSGIFGSSVSSAAILAAFVICAMVSVVLIPAVGSIEKPELYSRLEDLWWNLFETDSDENNQPAPALVEDSYGEADGIPDNMITNDPFPVDDDTPICSVKATYPLNMLHVFSCGAYDPDTFSFSIWDDTSIYSGGKRSPSANYYRQALDGSVELTQKAVITDHRMSNAIVLVPYCAFSGSSAETLSFGDRCLYRNAAVVSPSMRFSFEPDVYYKTIVPGYTVQAQSEYTSLPDGFMERANLFLINSGLLKSGLDTASLISSVRELLASEEFTFSYTPPELPEGEDPVLWFLTESKTGYSKHFAAAEVFLYRAMGIPARYSFGYRVREYNDGEAEVLRSDYYAFCEVFINGKWMMPEDALLTLGRSAGSSIGPETKTEVRETEDSVILPNGYDISHLKGTASMFGSYEDGPTSSISRNSRENDDTVVLIVDSGIDVDYIKAYSAGEYSYPEGCFTITEDTAFAPTFEDGKSFGEYAASAFMGAAPEGEDPDRSKGFRVFNLYAARYIYSPDITVSTLGQASGSPESFSMKADRTIVPLSAASAYDDFTLFEGGEAAGANKDYTKYALSKYTSVSDQLLYELRQFLGKNGIDPDSSDKGVLLEEVRSLLSGYTYTTKIGTIPEEEDPVMWFLTTSKSGYCIHFASAGTMLLRACGIPARYVSGYIKEISAGTIAEVTANDAHAWVEVFNGSTWQLVEMCVGTPAEGETLPAGLRAGEQSYSLPSIRPQWLPGEDTPSWTRWVLAAAAFCAMAAVLVILYRRNRPVRQQKAAIQYNYIEKYYYINEDTERLLNRMCYSREGVRPEDLKALGACVSKARSLLLYRHKYLTYIGSMFASAFWHIRAAFKNIRS